MALDFDAIKDRKRPNTVTVLIPFDSNEADAYEAAQHRLQQAKERHGLIVTPQTLQELDEAEEALADAHKAVEANAAAFRFEALGGKQYEELIEDFPPSKAQRDKWRKENPQLAALGQSPRWDEDQFPPALLEACCVEPKLSAEDAAELWRGEQFNDGERTALFGAARKVNEGRRVVELGKGSSTTAS
jgi:hypothetical protein